MGRETEERKGRGRGEKEEKRETGDTSREMDLDEISSLNENITIFSIHKLVFFCMGTFCNWSSGQNQDFIYLVLADFF